MDFGRGFDSRRLHQPIFTHARNNPKPRAQTLEDVHLLRALHVGFGGAPEEVNYVDFEVEYKGNDLFRITRIHRGRKIVKESKPTPIQRV
jgi:hypothetical protein